jgi:hypothetical protein
MEVPMSMFRAFNVFALAAARNRPTKAIVDALTPARLAAC